MFFWLQHLCCGASQSLGPLCLIRGCTSVTSSPGHNDSKKLETIYRSEQTDFAIPTAEGFGKLKGKSCSCCCEVKQPSCWSMPTGKIKLELGILISKLFDSLQEQSSQTRMSPQGALHIKIAAEWLQTWDLNLIS